MPRKEQHLVVGHLESISAEVFEQFRTVITALVDQRNGVYALYDGDRLYYVGLARNLRARLKSHLRDRHKGLWDRFSVYLTNGDGHMKELESLMLRVIKPEGNRVKGKLRGSQDKRHELARMIKAEQDSRRLGILGRAKPTPSVLKRSATRKGMGLVPLKADYKGRTYRATLRPDGTVRLNGLVYNSLSAAAVSITIRNANGHHFWKRRNAEGDWVRLVHLRDA